jgi:hypothetical protein
VHSGDTATRIEGCRHRLYFNFQHDKDPSRYLYVDNGDKESALYQSQPETQSLAKTLVLSHRLRFLTNSSPLSSSLLPSSTSHHQQHLTPQHLNNDSYIEWLLFGEFTFILRVSSDFRFFEYPSDFRRRHFVRRCHLTQQPYPPFREREH